MKHTGSALRDWRRRRRAKLPWKELEAEAARQGCSPADIFFDRAGHLTGELAHEQQWKGPYDRHSRSFRRPEALGTPT